MKSEVALLEYMAEERARMLQSMLAAHEETIRLQEEVRANCVREGYRGCFSFSAWSSPVFYSLV